MTFYNSIFFPVINKYDKGAAVEISTVFGTVYHDAKGLLKPDNLHVCLTTFFAVHNFDDGLFFLNVQSLI